jgi:hypothetical protein
MMLMMMMNDARSHILPSTLFTISQGPPRIFMLILIENHGCLVGWSVLVGALLPSFLIPHHITGRGHGNEMERERNGTELGPTKANREKKHDEMEGGKESC